MLGREGVMRRGFRTLLAALLCAPAVAWAAAPPPRPAVAATGETTLQTGAGQIRQLAFDGDPSTYFASAQDAGGGDHFTLVFDRPVAVRSVAVSTGRPRGGDRLDAGVLEVSADGKKFEPAA